MDSRFKYNDHDAKSTLQGLEKYPFNEENLNNEYWARNIVVHETQYIRWVILNSAAHHGYKDESRHGRISDRTLSYLKDQLAKTDNSKINVLVCHHHVYKIGAVDLDDYNEIKQGSAPLSALESGQFGSWLIIHGHRHWPSITYAPGGNNSPVVFSAGSLSAVLYDELTDKARN